MFRIESADWMPKGYAILSPYPVDLGALRLALLLDPDLFRAWLASCTILKFDEKAEGQAA